MATVKVDRADYLKSLTKELRELKESSLQQYQQATSTEWDPKALSKEVRDVLPNSHLWKSIELGDGDGIVEHRWDLTTLTLDTLKTDFDGYKRLYALQRKVDSYYEFLESMESPRDIEEEYRDYEQKIVEQEQKTTSEVASILEGVAKRAPGFSASLILEPSWSESSWDKPPKTYLVSFGKDSYAPSFTLFIKDGGGIESVEDVLEGGDDDFFKDPKQQYDYFNLVNEIRKPGSTSSGKILRLYTARPIKDRSRYESASTVPVNIFLASTFNEAEGLATDLGGSEQRDVWKVVIDSRYLVQTLEGSVKHYQTVGADRSVPVRSMELVSPGRRLEGSQHRVAFRITDQRKDSGLWYAVESEPGNIQLSTTNRSGLVSGNPSTKVLDLDPYMKESQTRYPSLTQRSRSYTIPYGSSSLAGEPKKLKQLLKDLIRLGVVDTTWKLTNSPHYRNQTVGDVVGSTPVDVVDTLTQRSSGEVVLYHGTSSTRWAIIKKKGLIPGSAHGLGTGYTDYIPGYSDRNVYLSSSIPEAEKYATRAAIADGSKAIVLKVVVRDFTKFVTDEDFGTLDPKEFKHLPGAEQWTNVAFRGWYMFQDENGLWGSGDWNKTPHAQVIRELFQSKAIKGLRKNKTVAYRGRIPASDLKVYEEYKPVAIKGEKKYDYETADADSFSDSMKRVRDNMKVYARSTAVAWSGDAVILDVWSESESSVRLSLSLPRGSDVKPFRLDLLDKVVGAARTRGWEIVVSQTVPGFILWTFYNVPFESVKRYARTLLRVVDPYVASIAREKQRQSMATRVAKRCLRS